MADPTAAFAELVALVAAAEPERLLPSRYGGSPVGGPLALCAATQIRPGLWLAVVRSPNAGLIAAPLVIDEGSSVRRAVPGDEAATALLDVLSRGELADDPEGFIVTSLVQDARSSGTERPMQVDQTHESVVVGDRQVVKWAVAAEPTPAPTLVAHLAAAGFTDMAAPTGFVTWRDGDQDVLVASAVGFLAGASDGWTWAVGDAGDYATGASDLEPSSAALTDVGRLVADLHVCLATPTAVLAVPRSSATAEDCKAWAELARSLLEQVLDEVDGAAGERLGQRAEAIDEVFSAFEHMGATPMIPVHGDLHVGQVLRWTGGYAVGDFDGNPVLPVSARLAPQPAARDVAGMLQSIDHVGRVVDRRVAGADPTKVQRWIAEAQATFLAAYEQRLARRQMTDLLDRRLLMPFQVEQECREFLYAVRHLPRWRYVPDQALQALIDVD